ncbi:uncharacterized protein LOC124886710 [Capsicum annuum]|uniref:uncharacterized protein LOC124886710 n=1 Tax=Capsicum annuum TaxID=4072 RepID=UPI001FB11599|nr:uncharacterized protein LOC124886710 [Capsicum annuum]
MCDSKLVARKFKDKIVSQLYIRIREIQDLVSSVAGRGHGATGRGKGAAGRGKGGSSRDQCDVDRGGGSDRGQCSADTRGGSGRGQGGIGRGLSSSTFANQQEAYNATSFVVATGYKRPATGFGVYSDPAAGTQVYNPGTSSERVLYGGINLKSASPINIDISFKPSGLKWNGKDAVTSTQ